MNNLNCMLASVWRAGWQKLAKRKPRTCPPPMTQRLYTGGNIKQPLTGQLVENSNTCLRQQANLYFQFQVILIWACFTGIILREAPAVTFIRALSDIGISRSAILSYGQQCFRF